MERMDQAIAIIQREYFKWVEQGGGVKKPKPKPPKDDKKKR